MQWISIIYYYYLGNFVIFEYVYIIIYFKKTTVNFWYYWNFINILLLFAECVHCFFFPKKATRKHFLIHLVKTWHSKHVKNFQHTTLTEQTQNIKKLNNHYPNIEHKKTTGKTRPFSKSVLYTSTKTHSNTTHIGQKTLKNPNITLVLLSSYELRFFFLVSIAQTTSCVRLSAAATSWAREVETEPFFLNTHRLMYV